MISCLAARNASFSQNSRILKRLPSSVLWNQQDSFSADLSNPRSLRRSSSALRLPFIGTRDSDISSTRVPFFGVSRDMI